MTRFLITILLCACSCAGFAQAGAPTSGPGAPATASASFASSKLTYKIIPAANSTWCYDIYANGKMLIHQPSVPGMPGNEGFKTKAGAEKVAQLVVGKIKKGQMPPTVDISEMKKLKSIP